MPPAMPTVAPGRYEIAVRQFVQQILPAGLPATTVWGYGATSAQGRRGLLLHNAPSLTIEARYDRPVRVRWANELVHEDGSYRIDGELTEGFEPAA